MNAVPFISIKICGLGSADTSTVVLQGPVVGKKELYLSPVSYTHLDVYKRQDRKINKLILLEDAFKDIFSIGL